MLHLALEFTLHGCTNSKISFLLSTFSSWTKYSLTKTNVPTHTNFLYLDFLSWLTLFPKLIVLNSHVPNNFGMWLLTPTLLHVFNDWIWKHSIRRMWPLTPTLLHVFNDWLWELSIINWKVHIQLASSGKWAEFITMGNSPFDPSRPLSSTLPSLVG